MLKSNPLIASKTLTPSSIHELITIVLEAIEKKKTLIPIGGGTQIFTGGKKLDIAINMSGLTTGFKHNPEDMTATLPAGMLFSDAQIKLKKKDQWIPLDPPDNGSSTVGGIVSANRWGPRIHRYGTARDWVISTTLINGKGKLVKSGANVVKNVSGYDLNKAYIGARGSLGILIDVSFKLFPVPENNITFQACFSDIREIFQIVSQIKKASLDIEALLIANGRWVSPNEKHFWLLVKIVGSNESIKTQSSVISSILKNSIAKRWVQLNHEDSNAMWETANFGNNESKNSFTKAVIITPKYQTENLASEIIEIDPEISIKIIPCRGVLTVGFNSKKVLYSLNQLIKNYSHNIEISGKNIVSSDDKWPSIPATLPLMRKLKTGLDPNNIFAPGTFLGNI